jgi:hypothetical protein
MEYGVYTRKGKGGVDVKVVLREERGETTYGDIRLEGIEEASRSLKEELAGDFSYFDVELEGE